MKSRNWELWDERNVKRLASSWLNPETLPHDTFKEDGSHWNLIQKVYPLIEGESVLDVGCGMGHLFMMAKGYIDYLGIDSSKAMIEKAQEYFPGDKDKFRLGDAYDLSISRGMWYFDSVVALGLILHLPESVTVIKQLWSKACDCVILSAWIGDTPLFWRAAPMRRTPLQIILNKHFILRRETLGNLGNIFSELPYLDRVEEIPFYNPNPGESNYIFKLHRKKRIDASTH